MTDKAVINRSLQKNEIILGLVIGLIAIGSIAYVDTTEIFKPVNSVESAKERMIGTWTYTEPISYASDPFPVYWVKWEVKADDTMTVWHAYPTDSSWGEGDKLNYTIASGKYSNDGTRWYGIKDTDGFTTGIFENGNIVLHGAGQNKTGTMQKEDKNPFSK